MAENTIDFSKGTNLKVIYEAGLRPWRVRSDERTSLKITNEHVAVIAPSGRSFAMDVQITNISVLEENELRRVRFYISAYITGASGNGRR